VLLDLPARVLVDEGTDVDPVLESVPDLQRRHGLGELVGECIVDAGLHEQAIGADTRLAGVSELGR